MIITEQKTEKTPDEWVRLGEEARQFRESDLYQEILKFIEFELMQDWANTPSGPEGSVQRDVIHATITQFGDRLANAIQTFQNEGEYARKVYDEQSA